MQKATDTGPPPRVAFEARLKGCKNVLTIGVRPNYSDYSRWEQELIKRARRIYYPTSFYAELLAAAGRDIFPSMQTYTFAQDKIKQTALFNLLGIPHPRTRFFYGPRQKDTILDFFDLPFIAKIPRGSSMGRGVFLIRTKVDLQAYCDLTHIAYIQEYLPCDRDVRAVVIGDRVVHAYWRETAPADFRSNLAQGAAISFDPVAPEIRELALGTARKCGWNDTGIDIISHEGNHYVLEANMKYGRDGFRQAGIDYSGMMEAFIENGYI